MNWFDEIDNNEMFYLASKETSLNDPQYRYRISKPIISTGGKKGNKTTYFENSEYFSEKLGVQSIFFGKYIGNKISCPTYFEKKKDKNDNDNHNNNVEQDQNKCISWKGEYTFDLIEKHLKDFIKIYILCDCCDYPETNLFLDEKKYIMKLCRSCGNNSLIPNKYMDKTYDFVQKNLKKQ